MTNSFKTLALLFALLFLSSCGDDSGTDPNNTDIKEDKIILIGGTGAVIMRTADSGQDLGSFLFASNWDGLKVELLHNQDVIATNQTEKTDGYTSYSPIYGTGIYNFDGFFKFENLSYQTEYQVRVFLNDTLSAITLPFTIQYHEAWKLDSVQACREFGWYPKSIENKLCYSKLMPNETNALIFDFYNPNTKNTVYPNPSVTNTFCEFNITQEAFYTVNLLDFDMTKVKTLTKQNLDSGYFSLAVQTEDLENGMYFVELKHEDKSELIPFVKYDSKD